MLNSDTAFTAWVCEDCYLAHAGYSPDETGHGSGETPLGLLETGTFVTDGMPPSDHDCEDRWVGHRSVIDCGEEIRDFDTSTCEGCGSRVAGARHALTFWLL
jgi:hypothetical protein